MMKKFAKIFTAIVVAFAAYSCIADATEDLGVKISGEAQNSITLSFEEQSKVQLGEKAEGVYPLYWSEGDAIAVNGVESNELTGVAEKATSATFTFDGEGVTFPLNIVTPAPEVAPEEGATVYPVVFPATQEYIVGNIDPKAMVLYGYAKNAEAGMPTLKSLVGVLQINVKGDATLTKLSVKAIDGNIAGTYNVNCTNGTLTEVEASNIITMELGNLKLNAEDATPIYVAIPAGSRAIWVTLEDAENGKMTVKRKNASLIAAGSVYEYKPFVYAASEATDEEDVLEIDSEEALVEFAKSASAFSLAKVKVVADLDMSKISEEDLAHFPIEGFGAFEFDGGSTEGYEISNLTTPLFGTTSAHIKNVKLSNINIIETSRLHSGALVCVLQGGSLANCETASGTFTYNNANKHEAEADEDATYLNAGCMVGYAVDVIINDCTNRAKLVVSSAFNERTYTIRIPFGGIVGFLSNTSYLNCDNLKNYGNIEFNIPNGTESGDYFLGGICGYAARASFTNLYSEGEITCATSDERIHSPVVGGLIGGGGHFNIHTAESRVNITLKGVAGYPYFGGAIGQIGTSSQGDIIVGVKNYGTISIGADDAGTKYYFNATAYIGGIVALLGKSSRYVAFKDCENHGTIAWDGNSTLSSSSGTLRLGGIAGSSSIMSYDNCDNYGTITVSGMKPKNMYVAGVVGFQQNYNATLENCDNNAPITITPVYKSADTACTVGGVLGHSETIVTTIKNCTNSENGDIALETSTKAVLCMGGIAGYTNGIMENVTNRGAIEVKSKTVSYGICLGGIVGYLYDKELIGGYNYGTVTFAGTSKQAPTQDESTSKYSGGTPSSIGGVIGYSLDSGNQSKLYNYESATVTIAGTLWPSLYSRANSFGGVVGCIANGSQDTVYNYADVIFTASVPKQEWSSSANGYIAGCIGYLPGALTDVENHGNVTVGKENSNVDIHYNNRLAVAGVYGRGGNGLSYGYTNVHNYGDVNIYCRTVAALRIAGVNAYNTKSTYTNVSNSGNITLGARAMSNTGSSVSAIGGVFAAFETAPSDGVNWVIINGATNNGNVTVSANELRNHVRIGGVVGYVDESTNSCKNLTNNGNVTFNGKLADGKNVVAGGVFGMTNAAVPVAANLVNTGDVNLSGENLAYTSTALIAGGLNGYAKKAFNITNEDGKRSMNLGNVIVTKGDVCPAAKVWAGGVMGNCLTTISGIDQFGAVMDVEDGNVGLLIGSERSDTVKVTDCKVGGVLATGSEETVIPGEGYMDPDLEEWVETTPSTTVITYTGTTLDENNWFEYIYSSPVTAADVADDNCSLITEAPKVQ